jgi:hypothetical protein
MKPLLLFIGECRSDTAKARGWTWKNGHLAAKTLFDALEAISIDPHKQAFVNLWPDDVNGTMLPVPPNRFTWLRMKQRTGAVLVALGRRVADQLQREDIEHIALVHPAARGKIRKRARYHAHVAEKLGMVAAR